MLPIRGDSHCRFQGRPMDSITMEKETRSHTAARAVFGIPFVVFVSMLLAAASAYTTTPANAQVAPPPAPEVFVETLSAQTVPVFKEFPARVEAAESVEIRARVEGFLESVNFREGTTIEKGQLLFTIDPAEFNAALRDAQASLIKAKTDLEAAKRGVEVLKAKADLARSVATWTNAQEDVKRYKELVDRDFISRQEYDQTATAEREASAVVQANEALVTQAEVNQGADIERGKAAIEAAEAQVAQAELNLSYTKIHAPVGGRIGKALIKPGGLVGRGESTLLATVTTIDPIYVSFQVDEKEYLMYARRRSERIREAKANGETVDINQPEPASFQLTLADDKVYNHDGTLNFVGSTVDAGTGTLPVRAEFPNPERILREGQFARIRVEMEKLEGAVTVPLKAVQELQGMQLVYVLNADNTVAQRSVQTGDRVGKRWVVTEGLKAGETVVVEGMQRLRQGMQVSSKPAADQ